MSAHAWKRDVRSIIYEGWRAGQVRFVPVRMNGRDGPDTYRARMALARASNFCASESRLSLRSMSA